MRFALSLHAAIAAARNAIAAMSLAPAGLRLTTPATSVSKAPAGKHVLAA